MLFLDDVKETHTYSRVTQASDYYAFGSVMREQKSPDDLVYRYGYQGEYSEKDLETGWNHFELREFDPIIARWLVPDPYRQYWSPYVGMGNNPINGTDPDGGFFDEWNLNTTTGELTKIGTKGGSKTQYVHFNGSKTPSAIIDGSKFFVGPVGINYTDSWQYSVSKFDLWKDVPSEYLGHYNGIDLIQRYKASGVKLDFIEQQEALGIPRPQMIWNAHDYGMYLQGKFGNTSSFSMAADLGMMPLPVPQSFDELIPIFQQELRAFQMRNAGIPKFNFNARGLGQPHGYSSNAWIRFLQINKGSFKGPSWLHTARLAYHRSKTGPIKFK